MASYRQRTILSRNVFRHRAAAKQIVDQVVDSSLLKRYGTLDEQAAAITFLASDEACYIAGTVLPVAGGTSDDRPLEQRRVPVPAGTDGRQTRHQSSLNCRRITPVSLGFSFSVSRVMLRPGAM
jgi:hypothetical protein